MNVTKNRKLIFAATIIYYAGAYIGETIRGGQLIIVFALALMLVGMLSYTGGKLRIGTMRFNGYILVFLLFCAASRLWAVDSSLAVTKVNRLLFILVEMILIHMCFEHTFSIEDMLKAIMYGGYIVVLYAFVRYGFRGIVQMVANDIRLTNELFNANSLGMCAAYSMVINIYYVFYDRIKLRDILMLPAAVLLVASQSRKAILIIILGVIGIILLKNLKNRQFGVSVLKVVAVLGVIALVLFGLSRLPALQPTVKRVSDVIDAIAGRGTRASNSAWIRFAYIELGKKLFKENPVLGIGIGNANIYTRMYYGNNHYLHNNYIELLACGGLIGFIIYYSMHLHLLVGFFRLWKHRDRVYDIMLVLLIIVLIVDYGMVSYYNRTNYLFLYMIWNYVTLTKKQLMNGKTEKIRIPGRIAV